ncbi:hypothetical protein VTK26DRAFT_2695 [Humicola hyalothermophila]
MVEKTISCVQGQVTAFMIDSGRLAAGNSCRKRVDPARGSFPGRGQIQEFRCAGKLLVLALPLQEVGGSFGSTRSKKLVCFSVWCFSCSHMPHPQLQGQATTPRTPSSSTVQTAPALVSLPRGLGAVLSRLKISVECGGLRTGAALPTESMLAPCSPTKSHQPAPQPPHLGDYAVSRHPRRSRSPEFKIRGRSLTQPQLGADDHEQDGPIESPLASFKRVFTAVTTSRVRQPNL